jgi:hypothetical protein
MYGGASYASNQYAANGDSSIAYINVSDTIGVSDSISFSISAIFSDAVTLMETLSTVFGQTLHVIETIGVVENVSFSISTTFSDTVNVVERYVASISVSFADSISVVENLLTQLVRPFSVMARIVDSPKMKAGIKAFRTIGNTQSKEYNGNIKSSEDFKGGVKPYSDRGGIK